MILKLFGKWTDNEIVEAISKGGRHEDRALDALHKQYFNRLIHFVSQRIMERESAKLSEDFVWEAIEEFIVDVKLSKYVIEKGSVENYLIGKCKFLWLNYIKAEERKERRETDYIETETTLLADDSDIMLIEREQWEKYIALADKAGKNCRQLLDLRLIQRMSMTDIAAQLINEGRFENEQTVRNAKSKCMKRMLELINNNS
jgi:DNA-directed RNA polymerase specialized sigma24 family protein